MAAEVPPTLELICFQDLLVSPAEKIEFAAVRRRLSGRPETAVNTKTEFDNGLESHFSK